MTAYYILIPQFLFILILFTVHLVRPFTIPNLVPHEKCKYLDPNTPDTLHETSECMYNISINFAAFNIAEPDITKHFVEQIGKEAGILLTLTHKEALKSIANDTANNDFANSDRNSTEFDDEDQIGRNHFMHIHFPDEGFNPDDLINEYSNSSEEVKNLAKLSSQTYRTLELLLDAVGEADTETGTNSTEYHFDGTTIISDTLKTSDISSHSSFTINAQHSAGSANEDVKFNMSSEVQNVLDSMGVSNLQIQMSETLDNPFFDDTSAVIHTPVISVIMKDYTPGREHFPILLDGIVKPFEFWMPLAVKKDGDDVNEGGTTRTQLNQPLMNLSNEDIQHFHLILPYNALVIVEIINATEDAEYAVVYLKDYIPVKSDFCGGANLTFLNKETPSINFMTEKSNFSQSHLDAEQFLDYYIAIYMEDLASTEPTLEFTVKLTRLSCLFRDEDMEFWSERGCVVGENSTVDRLHCRCNHASIFAGTQFTVPNDIDTVNVFDFKSSDFHDNPIVLCTVCVLLGLYIIAMIVSFWLDHRDRKGNVGITIMTDLGGPTEHFYYLVTVITGNRLLAGTSANVCIQLYGVYGRSHVHVLRENKTPVFKRGGIDSFLISSEKYLGKLEKIRIWHDNSGKSPEWYCRKIIVREIKTHAEFLFFIESWLQITGKQSTIIYEQRLATSQDYKSFKRRFLHNLVDNLDKSHLWLSVLRHPTASRFTRCQRLSCAFSILSLYLLSNLLYDKEYEDPNDPYGLQAYIVALQMSLLELPFGFFIIYMFWLVRQRYIPTLIVWRKHVDVIHARPRGSIFIPRRSSIGQRNRIRNTLLAANAANAAAAAAEEQEPEEDPSPPMENPLRESTPSETSATISIKSTNVQEFEAWVAAYHGDQGPEFIHSMPNSNSDAAEIESENRVGWGRLGLAHAIRASDPDSFFYSGNNDVTDVENMMDLEIKDNVLRAQARKSGTEDDLAFENDDKILQEKVFDKQTPTPQPPPPTEDDEEDVEIAFETCEMKPQRKGFCYLPWWFLFIAWIICLLAIFTFLYFTLLYGLHHGYLRSLAWLLKVGISFLLSVFIIQPINIVLVALIFTISCPPKYWSVGDEERFQILHQEGKDTLGKRTPIMMKVFEAEKSHPILTDDTIFEIKIATRRWERVKSAVGKLIFYLLLLIPLFIFSHSGRSENDYMLVRNMRNMLQANGKGSMINSPEELYGYLREVVTPMLYPQKKYNGESVPVLRFSIAELQDRINILIGVPRIRQVRAPKEKCHVPDSVEEIFEDCYFHYSISNQEKGTYYPFWSPVKNSGQRKFPHSNDVWKFRGHLNPTSDDEPPFVRSRNIRGEKGVYDGGGYVAELGRVTRQTKSTLKYLQRTNWIDHQTRAVFLEMTAFNPNLHLFIDVVVMIERGPSHSFHTSFQITPLLLTTDDDLEGYSWVEIAWKLLLIGAIILSLNLIWIITFSTELRLYKRSWFWLDVVMIIGIIVSLAVARKKDYVMEATTETIQRMKINEYVNLQEVAFWDWIQTAAFSITQFICFLKIWQLLVFLEGGFLVTTLTVGLASNAIAAYFCIILIVINGFACAGHVFFGSSMTQFRTLWDSWVTLVGQSLQLKIFGKLYTHDRIIGPIYGSLYGFVVTFLFLNILISILNQSRSTAKMMAREKFRNWGLLESVINHFCQSPKPQLNPSPQTNSAKKSKPDHTIIPISSAGSSAHDHAYDLVELHPARLEVMKDATLKYLQSSLQSENYLRMRKIKAYASNLVASKGYRIIPKRSLAARQEIETEEKMNVMRSLVAEYLRAHIGGEMTVEELHKYNDVHKTVMGLRIFKLEKLVGELQRKLKIYHT